MDKIFQEIREERARQDEKWGGPDHDDRHDAFSWLVYIGKHTFKTVQEWDFTPAHFRKQMIRVAALAVAAIEWVDRHEGKDWNGR